MMDFTSERLRKRFCKDYNIPISIFRSPYFEDRISLYESIYNSQTKWTRYVEYYSVRFNNNEELFAAHSEINNKIIEYIKSNQDYIEFSTSKDISYPDTIVDIKPKHSSVYVSNNANKVFVSIDMMKANYNSLNLHRSTIFDSYKVLTYEEFIEKFTYDKLYASSKYIRQVIFGNLNPKRIQSLERRIINHVLAKIINELGSEYDINLESINSDEFVVSVGDLNTSTRFASEIDRIINPGLFRVSIFTLNYINGVDGYIKKYIDGNIDIKSVNSIDLPFVIRYLNHSDVEDSDRYFIHENRLAKLIDIPTINII